MPLSLGFTGTQRGLTPDQLEGVREVVAEFNSVIAAHHGDCVGADAEFHGICKSLNIPTHIHPPTKDDKRAFCSDAASVATPKDYLVRNHDIADAAQVLIAAPSGDTEKRRSGTWSTVRYARKVGLRVFLVYPSGEIAFEDNDE